MGKLKDLYIDIINEHGNCCYICGSNDSLELHHIIPVSKGGTSDIKNLRMLCHNCNSRLSQGPREVEFINYLSKLLQKNQKFRDIKQEVVLGDERRYRADIIAQEQIDRIWKNIIIECKSIHYVEISTAQSAINQLKTYQSISASPQDTKLILATPGRCSENAKELFDSQGIELWDLDLIANKFEDQIYQESHPYFQYLFSLSIASKKSYEEELIQKLKDCPAGKESCYLYQDLVGLIIEHLFTPPLQKPIPESSDATKSNRRDFIIPNYAPEGFWAFLRNQYKADYIVVDAKNYKNQIKKASILQISNYLKPHGSGLFGVIFTRKGGDLSGCYHTLREQWMAHKKMIVVLNDEDVENMLLAKSSGGSPEDIIGKKIELFRLSM